VCLLIIPEVFEKLLHTMREITTVESISWPMDQILIQPPIPKCRLYWCLIESADTVTVMLVFSTPLVNERLSNLLTSSPPSPPPPFPG
jgi:hypothetical protein